MIFKPKILGLTPYSETDKIGNKIYFINTIKKNKIKRNTYGREKKFLILKLIPIKKVLWEFLNN